MPITSSELEFLKNKHGLHASWAVWADETNRPKSNMGDLSIFENDSVIKTLNPNNIIVAFNFSVDGKVLHSWENFHGENGEVYKLRYAVKNTPLWGAYMTDIIKDHVDPNSISVKKFLEKNPEVISKNVKRFKEEIKDLNVTKPILYALGKDVFKILNDYLSDKYKIIRLTHYGIPNNKEFYKEKIWTELNETMNVEEIKRDLKEKGFICPEGTYWSDLVNILKTNNHSNLEIQNPLILAGSGASDKKKYDRFYHHLDIAKKLNLLPQMKSYLESLDDSYFLFSEELKSSEPLNEKGYWDYLNDDLQENDDSEEVKKTIFPALDILKQIQKIKPEINHGIDLLNLFRENGLYEDMIVRGQSCLKDLLTELLDIYNKQKNFNEGFDDYESFCLEIFDLID